MDVTFTCESCGQSVVIDEAAAGQLVDCPKCGTPLEVPYKSESSRIVSAPPLLPDKTSFRSLPTILIVLAISSLIVGGGFFAQKFWKDQQTKAEEVKAETVKAEAVRAKEEEERKAAQEAKRIEDRAKAAKAESEAQLRNAEAKRAEEAAQQDRSEMEAGLRQLVTAARQAEGRAARPVRPLIEAAIQEFEGAVQKAEELPQSETSPLVGAAIERLKAAVQQASSEQQKIRIVQWTWAKDELGMTMTASFVIDNMSASDIKDIEITCHHFAPSGTEIDSNTRTIYEIVPTGHHLVVNNFNMGFIHSQVQRSEASITDYTVIR